MSRFALVQFNRLKSFLNNILPKKLSQYHYRVFFVFLLVALFGFSTQFVHAGFVEWIVEAFSNMLLGLATVAMALTIFFLRYFITLASYNNYIDVSVVKLGWVMVRDVANMFFVVSLLVIAFATILGVEKYEWKKGLVKLVIMAILINFSNLIAQLIIDAAHVFTITFLNAISASAGGNLINMFSLDKITSIITGRSVGESLESATSSIFVASVIAFLFAIGTTVVIGAYVVMMALRIVVLWALIILSPLAYLFSALPNGEKYVQKWWKEFTQHVIVAPVMVFFLWLAFATLGSGQIMSEIQAGNTIPLQQSSDQLSVSLTAVSTWESMSNYILALIFLMIGLKMTQETGATGSSLAGAAENFIKKTAVKASGYAAGRWVAKKTGKAVVGVGKGVGNYAYKKTGIKKAVEKTKARYAKWRTDSIENASKKAKDREVDIDNTKSFGLRQAKRFWAALLQPASRADKQADYYKRAGESEKKRREEVLTASDTRAGKYEMEARKSLEVTLQAKEATGVFKGEQHAARDNAVVAEVDQEIQGEITLLNPDLKDKMNGVNTKMNANVSTINGVENAEGLNAVLKQLDIKDGGTVDGQKDEKLAEVLKAYNGDQSAENLEKVQSKLLDIVEGKRSSEVEKIKATSFTHIDEDKDQTILAKRKDDFEKAHVDRLKFIDKDKYSGDIKDIDQDTNLTGEQKKKKKQKIAEKIASDKAFAEKQKKTELKALEEAHKKSVAIANDFYARSQDGDVKDDPKALAKLSAQRDRTMKEKLAPDLLEAKNDQILDRVADKMSAGNKEEKVKQKRLLTRDYSAETLLVTAQKSDKLKGKAAKSTAMSEELAIENRRTKEIRTAKAKDKVREDKGGGAVFYQQTIDKHQKEREEENTALNFRQLTKQGAALATSLKKGLNVTPGSLMQLASILTTAGKRGSEDWDSTLSNILGALDFKENIATDDLLGQQRMVLSALLAEKVEVGNNEQASVSAAFEKLSVKYGGVEQAQAVLKSVNSAAMAAGADGSLHQVGLFNDRFVDKKGNVQMRMETDKKEFKDKRKYIAERQNLSKITSVDGFVDKDKDGKMKIEKKAAYDQLFAVLRSAKGNTNFTSAFLEQMAQLREDDDENFAKLLKELPEAARKGIEAQLPKKTSSPPTPTPTPAFVRNGKEPVIINQLDNIINVVKGKSGVEINDDIANQIREAIHKLNDEKHSDFFGDESKIEEIYNKIVNNEEE